MKYGKFFYRLLIVGLIFFLVPIFLVTAMYFCISTDAVKSALLAERAGRMEQMKERIDSELMYVTKAVTSAALDPLISEAVYDKQLSENKDRLLQLHNRLVTFSHALNHVYALEIYFPNQELLVSNAQGIVPAKTMPENSISLYLFAEALRKPVWTTMERSGQLHFISFIQPLPIVGNFPQAYFAVHLNEPGFANLLQAGQLTDRNGSRAYLVTREGKIVSGPNRERLNTYLQNEEEQRLRQILQTNNKTGSLAGGIAGHVTMYAKLDTNDWVILYEVPESSLYEVIAQLVGRHLLLLAGFALVGVIALIVVLRRMYAPIGLLVSREAALLEETAGHGHWEWDVIIQSRRQLQENNERLNGTVNRQHLELKEAFLLRHLHGYYAGSSKEELHEMLKRFGFMPARGAAAMTLVPVKTAAESAEGATGGEHMPEDPKEYLMPLGEMCRELAAQFGLSVHSVPDISGGQLVLVLELLSEKPKFKVLTDIHMFAEAVRHTAKARWNMPLTLGIGSIEESMAALAHSFHESLRALEQRLIHGEEKIYPLPAKQAEESVSYPYEIETVLIDALKKNDREGCEDAFRRFLQAVLQAAATADEVRNAMQLLYAQIVRTLDDMVSGSAECVLLNHSSSNIWRLCAAEELEEWFVCELFPTVFATVEEITESRGAQTIEAVRAYLSETITQNPTLSSVAEHVGISPSYLSRLFKKITGQSFVQYVANLKIEKAKQLLIETNSSVAEIAEEVGYTERTFGRVFKNITGTTPANYRLQNKN